MLFEPGNLADQKARIVVIGVGGGGGNALNRMIEDAMTSVEFIAINTDAQDLENNNSQTKLQIGKELTKGLGAGMRPNIGKDAAEEAAKDIEEKLDYALNNPIAHEPLSKLVNSSSKVVIAFDDASGSYFETRPPDFRRVAVEYIFGQLKKKTYILILAFCFFDGSWSSQDEN